VIERDPDMRVSIVIPTLDRAQGIGAAMDSFLEQDSPHW